MEFLSQEWLTAVTASFDTGAIAGLRLTLQQVVTGGGSDVAYWLSFDDGTVTGGLGTTKDADVTFTLDRETAACIARDEVKAQAAYMRGDLKIEGNVAALLHNQDAVAALGPAMSSVPAEY